MTFVHEKFMRKALELAEEAAKRGEVPVACVIVDGNGDILAEAANTVEQHQNPLKHAEIIAIEEALSKRLLQNKTEFSSQKSLSRQKYLSDCSLYVTLEPCLLCTQAISETRIRRLIFGAYDSKAGAVENNQRLYQARNCFHRPEVISGIMEDKTTAILKNFFTELRRKK